MPSCFAYSGSKLQGVSFIDIKKVAVMLADVTSADSMAKLHCRVGVEDACDLSDPLSDGIGMGLV